MLKGFGIVSGGVQPETATSVAKVLNTKVKKIELKKFSNGERYARLGESVRNEDLFIFSTCADTKDYSINDALMETLVIIDAAKRASAKEISVIIPLLPYSRQDRKARIREPITSALVLSTLSQAGADRIITIDLHSTQIQAAFKGPFENLSARQLIVSEVSKIVKKYHEDFVVIAPDAGSVKNSSRLAKELSLPLTFLPKNRDEKDPSKITRPQNIENLTGKSCIIIDDMIDTGGTIISAAKTLKSSGAQKIIVCATHGILSNNASEKILHSDIDLMIVTDSVPQTEHQAILKSKLQVITVSGLLADAIKSIESGDCTLDID